MTRKEIVTVNGEAVTVNGEPVTVTVETLTEAVEKVSEIPTDAKMAVKDFIKENFNEIINNLNDLSNMNISQQWLESIPDIIEFIQACLKILGL